MVELLPIPLVPVGSVPIDPKTAVIMVDSQPYTGRRASEAAMPQVVIDHHETGGVLTGVLFRDLRPHLGATSTMVTGYLLEQNVAVSARVATALLYGIESETTGYPREASRSTTVRSSGSSPALTRTCSARIRSPKLPQSHFATFQHALANAFLYRDLVVSWCGDVTQPDIIAEMADFFVRFDQVNWALAVGLLREPAEALGPGRVCWAATRARSSATSSRESARPVATTSAPAARSPSPTPAPRRSTRS